MEERLKKIRKNHKNGKTQDSFAEYLGISKSNLASYESGRRAPSEAVIQLICQKCNVDENWLRTGEGEMFVKMTRADEIAKLSADLFKSEKESFRSRLIMALANMDDDKLRMLEELAIELAKKED